MEIIETAVALGDARAYARPNLRCEGLNVSRVKGNFNATPPASLLRARGLLFLHTLQASPAVPSKEPEQERWAGKQAGKKEQELSLAAHREQLKREHADRKQGRGSNGRARRVYCKLARREGGGEGSGEEQGRGGGSRRAGGGGGGRAGRGHAEIKGKHQKQQKSEGVEGAKADKSGKIKGSRAGGGKWMQKTGDEVEGT